MDEKKIKVTIRDTLAFYDDFVGDYVFNPDNSVVRDYSLDAAPEWLTDGRLNETGKEAVLRYLYGDGWRSGNGDGSRYQILEFSSELVG
ncbi:MAG: hypothetical protein JSS81_08055 [Acidobacteria bacterium]|nr:hypothetical protein [Acidobacteriota bacterium]